MNETAGRNFEGLGKTSKVLQPETRTHDIQMQRTSQAVNKEPLVEEQKTLTTIGRTLPNPPTN